MTSLFPVDDLHDAEAEAIDAIKAELAAAETRGDPDLVRTLRERLSEARIRRIEQLSSDTWDVLEHMAGRRLRR